MHRTLTAMLLLASTYAAGGPAVAYAQSTRPDILILAPEAGERVPFDAVLVALSLNSDVVDSSSITIEVDGIDVTAAAEISGALFTWKPSSPLEPGPHRVVVRGSNKAGENLDAVNWTFSVSPAAAIVATAPSSRGGFGTRLQGSLIVEGSGNSLSGAGAEFSRNESFAPLMWLNVGGLLAPGWSYSARVHASGYEASTAQPVNRYRADLRAPFFSLAVGDVNPFYHGLILAGQRVRGVQGDIKAGPLRLSAVSGKTRRAVGGLLDPLLASNVLRPGTFGQDLLAIRPAIGSGDRFQLGATLMRVRDDVSSITDLRVQSFNGAEDTRTANPPPKDNVVGGMDLTLRLMSGRLLLQYENAASLLANDISGGPLTQSGLDSLFDRYGRDRLEIDPSDYEDWFILNSSLVPLDPRSGSNIAHNARASLRAGTHQLAVEWRSVGGSYYSLGNSAMQRDIQGFRIRDSFTLLEDALVVSAAYEMDEDNLDNTRDATTKSTGAYGTLSWQKSRDALLVTASARVGSRSNDLAAGRFEARDESNHAFSGGVSVPLPEFKALRPRLTFNTSLIERTDAVNALGDTRDMYYLGGVQAESRNQLSQYALLFGINKAELTSQPSSNTDFRRILATVRHNFNERFTGLLDATGTDASSPTATNGLGLRYSRMELLGGGEYAHNAASILTLTGGLVSFDDERAPGNNTKEVLVRLRMSRTF